MTDRPRLLDLFCCSGLIAEGYARAGFDVVGIDIEDQSNYPFDFVRADAMAMVRDRLAGCWHEKHTVSLLPGMLNLCLGWFDAVHASPPCQAYSDLAKRTQRRYPMLIDDVRLLLEATGLPYVIENVEGAPLRDPVRLCGTMFPDLRVLRHRLFETNFPMPEPPEHRPHPLVFTHDKRKAHYGKLDQDTSFVQVTGGGNCTMRNARAAMGLPADDRRTKYELNEGVPPAYGEWVGRALMAEVLQRREAAA